MIQVRGLPREVRRQLMMRAASESRSLSDFLLIELKKIAEQPTWAEISARLARQPKVKLRMSAAEAVRLGRGEEC